MFKWSNGCFFDSQSLVFGGYGKHWIVLKEGKKKPGGGYDW